MAPMGPPASVARRWQRLTKRQQGLAVAFGGLLAVWVVDVVALRPLRMRLVQLHRAAHETEQRLMEATIASAQAESVNHAFVLYEPYVKPAGSLDAELAAVYGEVEAAVRDIGIQVFTLRQESSGGAAAETVSVNLETELSPAQLVQLLDRLQRSVQLLKVTELSIRVAEGRALRASLVIAKLLLK